MSELTGRRIQVLSLHGHPLQLLTLQRRPEPSPASQSSQLARVGCFCHIFANPVETEELAEWLLVAEASATSRMRLLSVHRAGV